MSSGKRLIINTQERAVSTDINRLQLFKRTDSDELLRYMFDVTGGNDDLDAGGVVTEPNTVETPLRAEIINGLMVKPQAGVLDLLVDPGVVMVMNPDGASDESNYKYVKDAGILSVGSLLMTANASGSTRIDVIECRINTTDLIVTDNRDIFNPSTGLFTATSVTKERTSRLEYRVRAGTPAAGYPGNVSGWLPLVVASVPTGTTTNNTITFWDVRPLLNDREFTPFSLSRDFPIVQRTNFDLVSSTSIMTGAIEAVANGRRLGGRMRRGSPGTDAESINFSDAANQSPGYVIPASGFVYVYLATPNSLPRWARYTDGPPGRVPRSPRGIPIITTIAPTSLRGTPSSAVALPTATGLGGSTTSAICVAAVPVDTGVIIGTFGDGRVIWGNNSSLPSAAGVSAADLATFTITDGITHPANAKALWVAFRITFSAAATTDYRALPVVEVRRTDATAIAGAYMELATLNITNQTGGALPRTFGISARIPLVTGYPATSIAARTVLLRLFGSPSITPTGVVMLINGYEL
jgi:hypothetical protein